MGASPLSRGSSTRDADSRHLSSAQLANVYYGGTLNQTSNLTMRRSSQWTPTARAHPRGERRARLVALIALPGVDWCELTPHQTLAVLATIRGLRHGTDGVVEAVELPVMTCSPCSGTPNSLKSPTRRSMARRAFRGVSLQEGVNLSSPHALARVSHRPRARSCPRITRTDTRRTSHSTRIERISSRLTSANDCVAARRKTERRAILENELDATSELSTNPIGVVAEHRWLSLAYSPSRRGPVSA